MTPSKNTQFNERVFGLAYIYMTPQKIRNLISDELLTINDIIPHFPHIDDVI